MILVDTNILSTFSKIGKLGLLYKVFNANCLYISPNVHNELIRAKKRDYKFVAGIFDLVEINSLMEEIERNDNIIFKDKNIFY